jgi:hypothetical protein
MGEAEQLSSQGAKSSIEAEKGFKKQFGSVRIKKVNRTGVLELQPMFVGAFEQPIRRAAITERQPEKRLSLRIFFHKKNLQG